MTEDAKKAIAKAFAESIKAQIGDDRNHGWGVEDSKQVIEDAIAEDATHEIARIVKEGKKPETYSPSEFVMSLIKKVINPSACRQWLEGEKRPDGQTVLAKSEKGRIASETIKLYS